jgi:CHASE2 domain-containing sensor protein
MQSYWRRIQIHWQSIKGVVLPGLSVIAIVTLIRMFGGLQFLEWAAFDAGLKLRPIESSDDRIIIVGITEADIQQIGQYPISDQIIADLLNKLQSFQPRVIGLDIYRDLPTGQGRSALIQAFQKHSNIIAVERALPDRHGVIPPPLAPPEQVGFADVILDLDGRLRRSLLGSHTVNDDFRFSLATQLAQHYFAVQGIMLENGVRDPDAMRFGTIEFPALTANAGGYVNTDTGGSQILLNFRNTAQPFRHISLQALQRGNVSPDWIRDRIVLIGMTANSVKDVIPVGGALAPSIGLHGVDYHAHAVSQILSAVLDRRPLLQTWHDGWEYLWIVIWGGVGIGLAWRFRTPRSLVFSMMGAGGVLTSISYGCLVLGWWIPFVPAALALLINQIGLSVLSRYERDIIGKINDRTQWLEEIFADIHNGPLQRLGQLLRFDYASRPEELRTELQALNRELRSIYDVTKQAASGIKPVRIGSEVIDLELPLDEMLYQTYYATLGDESRPFQSIAITIVKFELMPQSLSLEIKRQLCQFLQEALCNVNKHAVGVTRLKVICAPDGQDYTIRVEDNGKGTHQTSKRKSTSGLGSQQAKQLAKQLGGSFRRFPNKPTGTICELRWEMNRR